jgi:hypothetical protein
VRWHFRKRSPGHCSPHSFQAIWCAAWLATPWPCVLVCGRQQLTSSGRLQITQMPAGPIVQRYGGKLTLSVCLFGASGCFLAAPFAMERGGVALISALFGLNGLLTGPMMPTLQQVNRDWIPTEKEGEDGGQERPLVVRIQNLAHNSAPMLGAFLTPLLARRGWKRAFYIYGGVVGVWGALWHILVPSRRGGDGGGAPAPAPAAAVEPEADEAGEAGTATQVAGVSSSSRPEWRIFTLPSVLSLIFWQFASNFLFAVLQMLGPTYYTTSLRCSPERAGMLLALAQLVNFPGTMLGAFGESLLLKRGMPQQAMCKTLTVAASIGEAACALLYGMSTTATGATLAYGGVTLASMFQRAWSNFYEVGGKDVATLGSISNTIANGANLVTPYVALTMRKMFGGSWFPLLVLAAAMKVVGGFWLGKELSLVDGRTLLAARDKKKQK